MGNAEMGLTEELAECYDAGVRKSTLRQIERVLAMGITRPASTRVMLIQEAVDSMHRTMAENPHRG